MTNKTQWRRAIRNFGWRNKVRCGDRVVQIACLIRDGDRRPLQAEWWRGKEVYLLGVALNAEFFLRHRDSSVRLWEHSLQRDSVVARSVRRFLGA